MESEFILNVGDFSSFGAKKIDSDWIFTFLNNGKKASLLIYDKNSGDIIKTFSIPDNFYRGKVCSVRISGIDDKKHCYLYEVDEKLEADPYCEHVIGRDIYGQNSGLFCALVDKLPDLDEFHPVRDNKLIIYKMHMRGISMDKKISDAAKGNYKGLIGHIPVLKKLGINCVEIFPIYEFNEVVMPDKTDYWGYGDKEPLYFAPKASYFGGDLAPQNMIETVNALHSAGIAIIMEFCFPGCQNEDFVIEVAKRWAFKYGIDGFRFIGAFLPKQKLYNDPFLNDKLLFFEEYPLDVLPRNLGNKKRLFIENDSFIYPLRRLQNHMDGSAQELCEAITRQDDYFGYINYVAASNGFTLYDAYSYCDKHNEENGEENRDGNNYNCTLNYGVEGPTRDKSINQNRLTGVRTALATLMFSQGVPLINAGDELLNSACGNNNPYCQDNKIGWVNYSRRKDATDMRDYFIKLVEFRKNHPILSSSSPLKRNDYKRVGTPDVSYHGREPWIPIVDESHKSIGILFTGSYGEDSESVASEDIMLLFNFYNSCESFSLPDIAGKKWYFITNTGSFDWNEKGEPIDNKKNIEVKSGTLTVLVARDE